MTRFRKIIFDEFAPFAQNKKKYAPQQREPAPSKAWKANAVTAVPPLLTSATALPTLAYTYLPINDIRDPSLVGKMINIYGVSMPSYIAIDEL